MDVGTNRNVIIMSELPGKSLKSALLETNPKKQLTIIELLTICSKVVKLLHKIHQMGHIYRDVEPENIFIKEWSNLRDDSQIKTHRPKMMQANIETFLYKQDITNRSVYIRRDSFNKVPTNLNYDRRGFNRNFDVSITSNIWCRSQF